MAKHFRPAKLFGMRRLVIACAVASLMAVACKPKEPAATPTPTPVATVPSTPMKSAEEIYLERVGAQLEFLAVALKTQKATLDQVTCHCCGKSLSACYEETLTGAAGACPPT